MEEQIRCKNCGYITPLDKINEQTRKEALKKVFEQVRYLGRREQTSVLDDWKSFIWWLENEIGTE